MPILAMPDGTRELIAWMSERAERELSVLRRRASYGGRKGRSASRRLAQRGDVNVWSEPERIIAYLFDPMWARPPYGFAK